MSYEKNLEKLKIKLPDAKAPVGSYVATKEIGKLLYISGQISIDSNGNLIDVPFNPSIKTVSIEK